MTEVRRTWLLAGLVALLVLAAGCSSGGDRREPTGPTSGPPPTPATPSLPPSECSTVGAAGVPDGTWTGPITVTVRGSAPETRTRGTGSGELQVFVHDGTVTGGTWTLSWQSAGQSGADDEQAAVTLRGQIAGTVSGTAIDPTVQGRWFVTGQATVTSPVQAIAPIDESGRDSAALTVRTTACDEVTGTFAPSFRSADPRAASLATARWVGHRTG